MWNHKRLDGKVENGKVEIGIIYSNSKCFEDGNRKIKGDVDPKWFFTKAPAINGSKIKKLLTPQKLPLPGGRMK